MAEDQVTQDEEGWQAEQTSGTPRPGLVLVFTGGRPTLRALPIVARRLQLGRDDCGGRRLEDERVSREHAEVELEGQRFIIRDRESRNGTFVDGAVIPREVVARSPRTLRIGHSVFVFSDDVRIYDGAAVEIEGGIIAGPRTQEVRGRVARQAQSGESLLITGESGSGKELAARAFHERGPRAGGPFVAVNCATIPDGVAERLLFGAKKGAHSGATSDQEGYIQAADGGTLFLDEIGELDLGVQAKLLRVLETKEVIPLGAARPRPVGFGLVSATHRDLRGAIAAGKFRADLYFRIVVPEVLIPPLRKRPDEIPVLVTRELAKLSHRLTPHAKLVEACLLRPWPGNVRELLGEIRRAGSEALVEGATVVRGELLGPRAGMPLGDLRSESQRTPKRDAEAAAPSREAIEAALVTKGGNVAAAARALGVYRTQLYRWIKRYGISPRG
jgi:transcriptional regulator with PAS, ATPase and Fis domain